MSLFFKHLYEHILSHAITLVLYASVTVLGIFCISSYYVSASQGLKAYKAYGLDETLVYYPEYSMADMIRIDFSGSNEPDELLNLINHLDCVSAAEYETFTRGITLVNQERAASGQPFYLEAAQLPKDLKGFPYRIVKGRAPSPDAPDEICISSNYIRRCNVGDTLVLNRARNPEEEYRFKVTGFFDINSRALFGDSYVCEIDSSRGAYASAFTYGDVLPEDVTGNRDIMIIHPAAGYTVSDIKPQVLKVAGRGTAYTYEEYRDKLYDADSDNAVVFKAIAIATAIVTLELLIAYTLIQLSLRKNELVIYYLNGGSWLYVCLTACFSYLPTVLAGLITGICIYNFNPVMKSYSNGLFILDWKTIAAVSGVLLGAYILVNLLFFAYEYRRSPIEMLRIEG